ncbi:signal transduction histidine kinase [Azospirillum fermentarium]|uniref:MASE3 domain-containing protein n=1 Tax=Azospirillum fermentarium TaxID=1233114 RepID=UPI002227987F|nr:MASE3 domain-containing protein [Azospirillum fermentarium]MCW2248894.1 signal transduction histidine kinase [Azospirillum fermentarium]
MTDASSRASPFPSLSWRDVVTAGVGLTAVFVTLAVMAKTSFLLFHSLAELFGIAVAVMLLAVALHTRHINQSPFLGVLGLSCAAPAALDLIHTLTYPGMGVLPGLPPGTMTQYWVAARFIQAMSFLAAALAVPRNSPPPAHWLLLLQVGLVGATVLAIGQGWMPVCFDPETGLTPFKIVAEYVICAIVAAACGVLIHHRRHLDGGVFWLVLAGMVVVIPQELVFTLYTTPHSLTNAAGHFLKILSFYLIYRALVVTALRRPYEVMFLKLARSEQALSDHSARLEETVASRTAALSASEKRWRALLECSNDWFWETDAGGTVTSLTGRSDGLLGEHPGLWMGRSFAALPDTTRGAEDYPLLEAAMAACKPFRQLCFPLAADVPGQWVSVSGLPRFDGSGRFLGYHGTVSDITERRRAAEAVRQKQTMAALGGLVGGLAHEINNLLQPIISFSELALNRTGGDTRIQTYLGAIRDSGLGARAIMRDVLAFSRGGTAGADLAVPWETVTSAVRLAQPSLHAGIRIETAVDPALPPVSLTATELTQVLLNLLQNGRDAMPEGGTLTIAAGTLTLDKAMAAHLDLLPGVYVRLTVTDTGMGMDEATRVRVFEPFFTTKPMGQGTGLGLAVVHGIVRNGGGLITVDSTPGRGTTITIDLPAVTRGGAAYDGDRLHAEAQQQG